MKEVQISAYISETTKEMLDREVRATGVKKGVLIENALRHHLMALREIPAEYIIPTRIVVSRETFDALLDRMENPGEPTPALRKLLRPDGD